MKSLKQYKHLLAFDLSSYGAALSVLNRFADDRVIKVFEVSPCGTGAQLILLGDDVLPLQVAQQESESLFRSQILASVLIENVQHDLLPVYLSQKTVPVGDALGVLEGGHVSAGLSLANRLLRDGFSLVDFRVIRTFPKNVVLTVTGTSAQLAALNSLDFKKTCIESVKSPLKSLFEVLPG